MTSVIDQQPPRVRLLAVSGDPFDFAIRLRGPDGDPVDVTGWDFAATVTTGAIRLRFEWMADDPAGVVRFWLRGDDTARLPRDKEFPWDLAARQPQAGEGRLLLRGNMIAARRITDPLRSDPEAEPADAVPAGVA